MNATNGNGNNGNNGNDNNGNNGNLGKNYSYVNKNGFTIHVRRIPKVGESSKVPPRGQRTHEFSPDAYLLYKSHPQTIKERHNKIEANRRQRTRNAYANLKNSRTANNKTRRGPKGAKSTRRKQ